MIEILETFEKAVAKKENKAKGFAIDKPTFKKLVIKYVPNYSKGKKMVDMNIVDELLFKV
jgi:hypothetical protein